MHPFSILPFLFLSALLPNYAAALKCFTCDGICDCRDNQVPETCAPDAYCYTIKAAMSGQVLRKGCTRECRAVSNHNWQKCHLCDDDNLCNNHEYRAGLVDDCAVEEFIGLGFGLPAKRRRPAPPNQQYRRSLSQYAGDGPVQNNAGGGGYAQSPRQNDGGYGSGVSAPQQNQGEYPQSSYAQSPRQQQPSSGPSQNAAGSGSSEEFVSSPQLTDSSRGGQPVSARINAFLDRMSPRSVPLGFAPGAAPQPHLNQFPQQQSSGPQQNSFGTFAGPQQNSFGPSGSGGPRQNSVPEAAADFGQGVRIAGNGGVALNMVNSFVAIGALLAAALVLAH